MYKDKDTECFRKGCARKWSTCPQVYQRYRQTVWNRTPASLQRLQIHLSAHTHIVQN